MRNTHLPLQVWQQLKYNANWLTMPLRASIKSECTSGPIPARNASWFEPSQSRLKRGHTPILDRI